MVVTSSAPRRRHAIERDGRILDAARALLIEHPESSMAQIAEAASVGMSALYSRFGNKDALLLRLAEEGNELAASALDRARQRLLGGEDARAVFEDFVRTFGASDAIALAALTEGLTERDPDEIAESIRLSRLGEDLLERFHRAGALRAGVSWFDLGVLLIGVGALRGDGPDRTIMLKNRVLTVLLDGLRADAPPLAGDPAEARDFAARSGRTGARPE